MISTLQRSTEALLALLFPPRCFHCSTLGTPLCRSCLDKVKYFDVPRCSRCDEPASDQHHCTLPTSITRLSVVGPHAGVLREGIHGLKYENRTEAAAPLAALLARRLPENNFDGIIPVPLGTQRAAERGYNQAEVLANELGRIHSLPVRSTVLTRVRETRPQVGLTREERHENVAEAFDASAAAAGNRWLVVDDVCTTGATLGACADALRVAGASEVYAATVTRSS